MTTSSAAHSVAITGAAGFVGSHLVPALSGAGIERIVGLDVRDPTRAAPGVEHHLVDVTSRDIAVWLSGVDTIVHLAAIVDPVPDESLMARANVEGTRRMLEAAARTGVRKIVRVSTAAAYGAWASNPVPLTEDAPLRPNPGFAPAIYAAEAERLLFEWQREHPDVCVTVLRAAPVLGAGAEHLWARVLAGWRRPRIRGEGAPVQVVHVEDLVNALALVVQADHPGVFDVAAPGWLGVDDARTLLRRGVLPAIPVEVMRRVIARSWQAGVGDMPPAILPYLMHPWIVATDRLEAFGWRAAHTNEETLLETHDALAHVASLSRPAVVAAVGTAAVGVAGGIALRRILRD